MADTLEDNKPYPPWASIAITGKELDPQSITDMLGIKPHESQKRHDKKRDGIREWSIGSWILSSAGQVDTVDITCHINWLVDQLFPVKNFLKDISKNEDLQINITVFWIMPSTHEVFTLSPELLKRLAALKTKVYFSIYSP